LDIPPSVLPAFGQTARRGWRAAPPAGAGDAEYWRQRQARLLAEAEFRRRDQQNRQGAELVRSIGEALAASGEPIKDGECWLADQGDEIRCSGPDLQAAIKGREASLIALHKAITNAGEADAAGLLQVRDGKLRLLYQR
jgi:IS5 family transposase